MRKAIIIIIIALLTVVKLVMTVSNFSFAEDQDYYYFETVNNIYGFGIDQCNQYYVHNFETPVSFIIENGIYSNDDIKDMITNNPIFEQRLISQGGLFTFDVKLYLTNDNFSFAGAGFVYTSNSVDIDNNDLFLSGENKAITGVVVKVDKIQVYVSYNNYYLDVNYSNSDSFFRIYNNAMAINKYWSNKDDVYGFYGDSIYNVVDFTDINSDFFLNVEKKSILKNDNQLLSDSSLYIYPLSSSADRYTFRTFINDTFGDISPVNNNDYFNTDTVTSGYINIDGIYVERSAQYVGKNSENNKQIWKLDMPINLDLNSINTLEFSARNNDTNPFVTTDIIPLTNDSIIINNTFSWGSLLELTGIFGVAVDLILQILNYEILGIELGFIIFAPLLLTLSLGIIRRIRG